MDWGYEPSIHFPSVTYPQYCVDIALIANSYDWIFDKTTGERKESIKNLIVPLIENDIKVDIWGKGWDTLFEKLGVKIKPNWLHGPLPYLESNKVYNSAKINIGLQSYKNQVTSRTYEVLGAAGFLLSADFPAVRKLFDHGKHLIVSDSPKEILLLVKHYLQAEEERKTIANNGHAEVINHTYKNRVEYMIQVLQREGVL